MNAVVIVEFSYEIPRAELAAIALDFADNVKPTVEGLVWKLFLDRPEAGRSAGVYLFTGLAAARAYVQGPIMARLREASGFGEVSATVFEVLGEASQRAGAQLQVAQEKGI